MAEEGVKCEMGAATSTCITLCKIDAVVSVDERGQLILPKDVREKAGIKAGDKLALISCEKEGKIECISLLKADKLSESLKKTLGPLLQDILR
jgi:AbrB family looped-hinge helix DNA binding protein